MTVRLVKFLVVFSVALFFTLIAFNNLTDFESNRVYIRQVLTLDTIHNEAVSWRAIGNPTAHLIVYWCFILWEIATAIVCWIGSIRLLKGMKSVAIFGLAMGFLLYMIGFVDVGSEWFYLWQSELKSAQTKAILFSSLLCACMLFVSSNANETLQ